LYSTIDTEIIDAVAILGNVQVVHYDEYKQKAPDWIDDHPDCFYVNSKRIIGSILQPLNILEFHNCRECVAEENDIYQALKRCRQDRILRCFDPYIGIGGMGKGLSKGCSMRTVLGVDIDPSACETMRSFFYLTMINF